MKFSCPPQIGDPMVDAWQEEPDDRRAAQLEALQRLQVGRERGGQCYYVVKNSAKKLANIGS
jgi:hypothetical protein